ncbi:MAG: nucleotidyl transferase AbiEii/AbiGii toxin family protein [Kiritimatiellales bacterium]|nr:nucleotidyl transferase AbiEii/AbiGii toxin family protein [Kiritimatiellota bacterium]MBL7012339.1 nucleotidyl transferase AbiEii/AbiGii toxin family protein [Kiritimatiellales bacterium]
MNQAIQSMLEPYQCKNTGDYENALREIFQELALLGLWRGKFFEHAAFYGGTALRILHGLDRFSEDIDFSLLRPNPEFNLAPYCRFIENELNAWGFPVAMQVKAKTADSAIESAFLKADTITQMLIIEAPEEVQARVQHNQILRIKLEVDTNPPAGFQTESRYLLQPIPFPVRTYTLPSLFAGKMHALLFRNWGNRVKGRDWFDLVWYISRGIPLDLPHLEARMRQTGHWTEATPLSEQAFREMLMERIRCVDIHSAQKDAERFIRNPDAIAVWSAEFFEQITLKIQAL